MCLCVRVVGGEWVVKVVARSEEYKCIYMFGGESGKLLSYLRLKLGARRLMAVLSSGIVCIAHETNELMSYMFAID